MSAPLMVKRGRRYCHADKAEILDAAAQLQVRELPARSVLSSPDATRRFLRDALAPRDAEAFAVVFCDNRHHVLSFDVLFRGTVNAAAVYPREVVKLTLARNASAVILAHNHPSGSLEPSTADELITRRLKEALALIDVRVLDHVIVSAGGIFSFADRGLL